MACYRKSIDCEELHAMESGSGCYCLGVIFPEFRQEPEYSKRFCIVPTSPDYADVQLDIADKELFLIQSVIATGFLEVLQQAGKV